MGGWHPQPLCPLAQLSEDVPPQELSHLTLPMPLLGSHLHHQGPFTASPFGSPHPTLSMPDNIFLLAPLQVSQGRVSDIWFFYLNWGTATQQLKAGRDPTKQALPLQCTHSSHTLHVSLGPMGIFVLGSSLGSPESLGDCHSPHPHSPAAPAPPALQLIQVVVWRNPEEQLPIVPAHTGHFPAFFCPG